MSGIEYTAAQFSSMTPEQVLAYRVAEANMVKVPYLIIAGIFLFVAALIYFSKLPEIKEDAATDQALDVPGDRRGLWAHSHLIKGVLAQFFYVGAQVGVASFVIRFAEHSIAGAHEKVAAHYLQMHLIGFMVGRFAGSAIMKYIPPAKLLGLFASGALVCVLITLLASGAAPVWAVVFLGFFHSIMFPTIFALSLKNLGPYTKLGSSLLVMSIIGGAVCPAIMGIISDATNIQRAFVVPLVCYIYVLYFAARGYKPAPIALRGESLAVAPSEAK